MSFLLERLSSAEPIAESSEEELSAELAREHEVPQLLAPLALIEDDAS